MTKPHALRRRIEEYAVIERCNFGVINMTMPPFFQMYNYVTINLIASMTGEVNRATKTV